MPESPRATCCRRMCHRFIPKAIMVTPEGKPPETKQEYEGELFCSRTCIELAKEEDIDVHPQFPDW